MRKFEILIKDETEEVMCDYYYTLDGAVLFMNYNSQSPVLQFKTDKYLIREVQDGTESKD